MRLAYLWLPAVFAARADSLLWDPLAIGGSGGTGTWNLNSTANWWNGSSDVTWKDNSANGTNTALFSGSSGMVTLNTSLSSLNLQFVSPGYKLSGSGTLTLGAGGIDASSLSSGTTTISNVLSLSGGQQSWLIGSGSTLAINGAVSRKAGATVDFAAGGITSSTLTNVNSIIGGWATTGDTVSSITTGDWAANNGSGGIVTCTGYTLVSGNQTGAGEATQNWKNSAAGTVVTLTTSATVNSLVQQGDFSVPDGSTLTLGSGGLILQGISRWMLDNGGGNMGSAVLNSGLASGELFVHVPNGNTANNGANGGNWRIWPRIQNNGATPMILVKDGPGCVTLAKYQFIQRWHFY